MSVQFGKCNFDGKSVDPKDFDEVRPVLAPYGPDGEGFICKDNLGILYRPLHTTKESRHEIQPYVSASGFVLTWDGRLDNREELIGQIGGEVSCESADVDVVAGAYQRWGTNAFAKLIGDWALSILDPKDRSVILAKDFVGTRHLYYTIEEDGVIWCTILEPLVLFARHSLKLEEEYVAGWLTFFPATHLTPYVGIHAVPPCSFARVVRGTKTVTRYWDFDPGKRVRYRTEAEYEEHFRTVFSKSLRRRLRSDKPILAELSGGMDSSSIVSMADEIISQGLTEAERLDTVSYYNNSEPNWNELPYISTVEEKRGQTGHHIEVGTEFLDWNSVGGNHFAVCPSAQHCATAAAEQFQRCIAEHNYAVLLSGIGGDEVTGGVPSPVPELADLIARLQLRRLAHQLKCWALNKRKPWFHLLWEAMRPFMLPGLGAAHMDPPRWLASKFAKHFSPTLKGYPQRLNVFGPLPSFQFNLQTLDTLRRQLASDALPRQPVYEVRFPFLDRELLDFLFSLPPEQLVRPGQRRSLMRRALAGIVPGDVLNRRRKAYSIRSPLTEAFSLWLDSSQPDLCMVSEMFGIVDARALARDISQARTSSSPPLVALERTIWVELWLASLVRHNVLLTNDRANFGHMRRRQPNAQRRFLGREESTMKGGEHYEVSQA